MAYTSVIPVYRLDNAVRYAQDKQKTTRQHGMPLAETVDYALNREKTETDGFESGLGCTTQSAYEDMRANAVRWHKTDGVQGYHLVQSFAEGEVTPELAHKIGLELAERVLGGRYQAIVTTHLNTSHYHNHIVWSSVAMNSGIKYHSNAKSYGLELMQAVFSIVQGTVSTVITQSGTSGMNSTTLPQELVDAINNVGFWDSIPLWAVTLIGGLLITVLSFVMILTVYGRMFSLWMYAAIAPIPLAAFAGEPTANVGKNFIRSYAGVCLQGLVIALSCVIFSALAASPPSVDTSASVVTAVWTYVAELTFNLLVLVGAIKGCDRIVKEIMGL